MENKLRELRDNYHKGLVSVIVGAGFSKNACEEYPSWEELLYDMVVELYQDEIEKAFIRYQSLHSGTKTSLDEFTSEEVYRVIKKIGYLKVVTEYISRKGYRETLEHYIEERIPYIDTENRQFKFVGKNREKLIDIVPDNFSAHQRLLEGSQWERIYTTNYDRLLEYASDQADKKYKVIKSARELSVSRETPSIIKLHGDLNHPQEKRVFIFDGNPHQQYIISEDDYENYPQQHEAFTQLMRISLLQGVFCLIGFSGDDPNFINWINWVRDVLVKDFPTETGKKDDKRTKIYLIDVTDKEPDEVKRIFYYNHNILYVPLYSEEVKRAIGAMPTDETRDLFCKFFDYLYRKETSGDKTVSIDDVDNKKEYNTLWDKVYDVSFTADNPTHYETKVTIDEEKVERLFQLKPWYRVVSYNHRQKYYLEEINQMGQLTTVEARLALLALEDTGMTVDGSIVEKIAKAIINEKDTALLNKIINRTKTLHFIVCKTMTDNVDTYEEILRALFRLDFKRAIELLIEWNPMGVDVLKKAALCAIYDQDNAIKMLRVYMEEAPVEKEQFYATRLLNMIENTFPPRHSVDRFENANVQDYYKMFSSLRDRVTERKEKIGKYGDGKHVKVIHIGDKPTKIAESLSVLQFMIEAPAFVSYKNFYTLMSSEEWYEIHKQLFEQYPLPTLYFGLQCTDKKVKSRIGQDYAYSDILAKSCLDDILSYLLKAYLAEETPGYLREPILIVSRELFVSVAPKRWEEDFMQIWEQVVLRYRFEDVKNRMFDEMDKFVNKALNSLKTQSLRQRIITDILAHAKADYGFAINCFYYLSIKPTDIHDNRQLPVAIDRFIDEIENPSELNIAGNMYQLLTVEQKKTIVGKCRMLLTEKSNDIDDLAYHASQFFVKDDVQLRRLFVESVCNNPRLWDNGITEGGGFSSQTSFLKLSAFTRRIRFDQNSVILIYNKLKNSANQVLGKIRSCGEIPFLTDFDDLLSEMLTFLNDFKNELEKQDDYKEVYGKISQAYYQLRGVGSIGDGLLSEYDEDVSSSLKFIQGNARSLTRKKLVGYFNLIINRVLMRNSDGLDICIAYLWYFLKEGFITMEDEEVVKGLLHILDRYEKENVQNCNMDLVLTARSCAKIANKLKSKGYVSKGIDYWIGFQKSSRFYCNFN